MSTLEEGPANRDATEKMVMPPIVDIPGFERTQALADRLGQMQRRIDAHLRAIMELAERAQVGQSVEEADLARWNEKAASLLRGE